VDLQFLEVHVVEESEESPVHIGSGDSRGPPSELPLGCRDSEGRGPDRQEDHEERDVQELALVGSEDVREVQIPRR